MNPTTRRLKTMRAEFLVENLDLEMATGLEGAEWEQFQLDHLNDDSMFRHSRKSRQIAWSFLTAMEAVAEGILTKTSSIFVSINLQESVEKINYVRQIREALNPRYKPRLVRDAATYVEFHNGARLISLPARPPRGKSRFNVYLDEFAHTPNDREVYKGALPIISKGGRLRTGSSPSGASGLFWEIDTQTTQRYPGYTRRIVPWWAVYSFCKDPIKAIEHAPKMTTDQRIEQFGNDRIIAIFQNMILEDFQQEYECMYIDEQHSWIPWPEIRSIQGKDLVAFISEARDDKIAPMLEAIEDMARAVGRGAIESIFGVGVDIGRTRNTTEIFLVGMGRDNALPLRGLFTLDNCSFKTQETILQTIIKRFKIHLMQIDGNGIGMQIAESLSRQYPTLVRGVNFTNATKSHWATQTKMLTQQGRPSIPVDTDLAYQIHSIKKMITPAKNVVFDTQKHEKHHADKFWAWALGLDSAVTPRNNVDIQQSHYIGSHRL